MIPDENVFCLNAEFSTTRRVTRVSSGDRESSHSRSETTEVLPLTTRRHVEGGLRVQGYWKPRIRPERNYGDEAKAKVQPLITVITAVFNGGRTLDRSALSVINQTCDNVEYIVIDGGSTDNTVEILCKYDHAIDYWVSEPDDGIYSAWNKGLSCARGDWICFLGADDFLWEADVIDKASSVLMQITPDVRVVYGRVALLSEQSLRVIDIIGEPWSAVRSKFRQVMSIPHVGLLHHRSIFAEHGNFDTDFRIAGDYELLLRELRQRDAFFIPMVVAGMRAGGISSNPTNTLTSLREVRAAQKKNGIARPGSLWIMAVIRVRVRQLLWRVLGDRTSRRVLDCARRLLGKRPVWTKVRQ